MCKGDAGTFEYGGRTYGVSAITLGCPREVRFEVMEGRGESGKPQWIRLDTIGYPELREGEILVIFYCRLDDITDHSIVAVARREDAEIFRKIRLSWKADPDQKLFVPVSPERVSCFNEGAGV